ncbi:hypothetical protein [Nocardia abscessus]|uniref:hypothetical protein n=1 Tax=Nocardia abscessus TaxID=120957 RepID=UPI002458A19D|nr:hypothetical protein [Nocardia abscessus]
MAWRFRRRMTDALRVALGSVIVLGFGWLIASFVPLYEVLARDGLCWFFQRLRRWVFAAPWWLALETWSRGEAGGVEGNRAAGGSRRHGGGDRRLGVVGMLGDRPSGTPPAGVFAWSASISAPAASGAPPAGVFVWDLDEHPAPVAVDHNLSMMVALARPPASHMVCRP